VSLDALRFAVATFTALPAGPHRTDRAVAGRAMLLAPLAGAVVGLLCAGLLLGCRELGLSPLTAAVAAVGAAALATRALHLDGLADLADGLGSRRPAAGALEVMRRSDIGPFGVVTLVLVLLLQVATVAELATAGLALSGLLVAAVTGRCAVTLACRTSVPAARQDGLGAHVAGAVPLPAAAGCVLLLAVLGAVAVQLDGGDAWRGVAAVLLGLTTALALERHAVRRLGGVTGDVLGALVETATTVALVVLATG
jgi:adenosylcobinamide-GDP ribazoletransferase